MTNKRPTLSQFIALCLGPSASPSRQLNEMLSRSFGAASFDRFWHYWNPVYGYALYYWCYRPLRRYLPRSVCVLLTFFASGFVLHDLPFGWWVRLIQYYQTGHLPIPFVALWFSLMGGLTLLSQGMKLDLAKCSFAVRASTNGGCILLALITALRIVLLVP